MNQSGPPVDVTSQAAMWSAISAIVAVLATQGIKAFIVWLKARETILGKRAELSSRTSLSDREQLNTLIGEMRVEYKSTIDDLKRELKDTDARLGDAIKNMDELKREDAQLRVDVATAKRDLVYAVERHERDRQEWAVERAHLLAEVDALKLQVAQLQKQSQRHPSQAKE
jgi:predicted  nucleic acid-binding Zn-ribbon protein